MSAFADPTLKFYFRRSKPSPKLSLKTKWYHGCGCCVDSQNCEKLKKHVTDKYLIRPWTLIIFFYYCNAWMTGVYIPYMCDRNFVGKKTSQTEWLFESNLRYCGYFECTPALWILFWTPDAKATHSHLVSYTRTYLLEYTLKWISKRVNLQTTFIKTEALNS